MKSFEYDIKTNTINPQNLIVYQRRDVAWTMSLLDNVPMWAGWNSKVTVDNLPKQHNGYMETICLPPTRPDVVAETLKILKRLLKNVVNSMH